MQIEYQRDLKDHYLVLHGTQQLAADAYQIHMIQENSLRGFTVCHTELVDDEIRYAYRITSMQSLDETMELKPAGNSFLRELFRSLSDALEELERYLLQQDGVLLHPSFIFTDAAQQKFLFCYYPENTKNVSEGMKDLSEFLLPHLDERDRQAVILGFSFYQSCAAGEMTESKLKELIYANDESFDKELSRNDRLSGSPERAENAEIIVPSRHKSEQDKMTSEEIRARILDDFFSDEEEAEMERRQQINRRRLWFLLAAVCALGTAAAFAVTGWVQTGIGSGVLIEGLAILLWRKRRTLFTVKAAVMQRMRHRKKDGADQYENVDPFWQTYEERAEALENSGAYNLSMPATRSEGTEETGISRYVPWTGSGTEELPVSSGYEETIWLDEEDTGYPKMQIWLERTEQDNPGTEAAGKQNRESGSSRIPLTEQEHLIGKNAEVCDIAAASAAVSRMHARLTRAEQGYVVTDLRSRNGTFINGTMLESGKACQLHDGDIARFADVSFRYCCIH